MNLKKIVAVCLMLTAVGCKSKPERKSDLPAIMSEEARFIRLGNYAFDDLWFAAVEDKRSPTQELVETEVKRQRALGIEVMVKDELYLPALINRQSEHIPVTVEVGREKWLLIETFLWDEKRAKPMHAWGVIPLSEYQSYLSSQKKGQR